MTMMQENQEQSTNLFAETARQKGAQPRPQIEQHEETVIRSITKALLQVHWLAMETFEKSSNGVNSVIYVYRIHSQLQPRGPF